MVSINTNCYVAFPGNTIRARRGKSRLTSVIVCFTNFIFNRIRNTLLLLLEILSIRSRTFTVVQPCFRSITLSSNSPLLLTNLSKFILVNFYQRCVLFRVKFVCSPSMDDHIVLSNIGLNIICLTVGMFPSCRVAKDREVFGLEKWKETHCLHTVLPTYYKIAS